MDAILGILKAVIGISSGASPANNASGALTRLTMIPLIAYCVAHASDKIDFGQVSLAFLAVVISAFWMLTEVLRWSRASPQRDTLETYSPRDSGPYGR